MDCEECGYDLSLADDITADLGGGWVTVRITCPNCGTVYFADIQLDNFDRED